MRIANGLTWPSRRRTSFGEEIALTTWNNYVNLRNATQETYAAAEKEYDDSVGDTLIGTTNSHKWWSTLKTAIFGVDVAVPSFT